MTAYTIFATYDEAQAALDLEAAQTEAAKENAARAAAFEEASREHLRKEQESFDRCDTDGFLSQFCHTLSAQQERMKAELAKANGKSVFPVLVDAVTGELRSIELHILPNTFAGYGVVYKWHVKQQGQFPRWVTDFKREKNFAKHGLRKAYMVAPAKVSHRSDFNHLPEPRGTGGLMNVHYGIYIDVDAIRATQKEAA